MGAIGAGAMSSRPWLKGNCILHTGGLPAQRSAAAPPAETPWRPTHLAPLASFFPYEQQPAAARGWPTKTFSTLSSGALVLSPGRQNDIDRPRSRLSKYSRRSHALMLPIHWLVQLTSPPIPPYSSHPTAPPARSGLFI